jgi:hypothetical protein
MLDEYFKDSLHSLADLFTEERRKLLSVMTRERLARFEGVYRELYEESRPLITFMRESDVPVPPAMLMAAEYTLLKELVQQLPQAAQEPVPDRAFDIAHELEALELTSHVGDLEILLRQAAQARADRLRADPLGPDLDQVHRLLDLAGALGMTVNLWQVQNAYHAAAQAHLDELRHPGASAERVREFWRLGERLSFNLNGLRAPAPAQA